MFPGADELLSRYFGVRDHASVQWEKIERGGSDRDFWRMRGPGQPASAILAHYGTLRAENAHYARVAAFLTEHGVRVPRVYFHDADARVIALEDLGKQDLWGFRDKPWAVRRPLYEATLREVHHLHTIGIGTAQAAGVELEIPFDAALYRWEQKYCFEHCFAGAMADRVDATELETVRALPVWEEVAGELAAQPRVLVHRDFQSQNVLIIGGRAGLIDFQGMREGLAAYDLASLLFDPYVVLTDSERAQLLAFYRTLTPRVEVTDRTFQLCAVQRLMQALGAYGNLGLRLGKPAFLEHIPRALASLSDVVDGVPELGAFADILHACPALA